MILFKKAADLRNWLAEQRKKKNPDSYRDIGFAPTMGALHQGHLSLIQSSKSLTHITVASIFVNPTQFNDPADFEKYPITLEKDIQMLEAAGCDVLFLPSVKEIYPDGTDKKKQYDLGFLETILDGKYRPGHFQGVCMVVHRLLEIVEPDSLFLGQKDYQQCMVITKLIDLTGMKNKTEVVVCPTLREADGLAMSSRNMRLNEEERKKAPAIFQCLQYINNNLAAGDITRLKKEAFTMLVKQGFKPDYVEIADAATLATVNTWDGHQPLTALIAAFLNDIRLIDNMVLTR